MKSSPATVKPGYVIRNGERLTDPTIAEDPDYDMKIYGGEPLKHDHGSYPVGVLLAGPADLPGRVPAGMGETRPSRCRQTA